jgi:hypothetical protein
MKRSTYWFFAVLILLIAAGLRLWGLAEYPPGPHYDEAANVLIARSIAFGGAAYFPIVPGYQGREALFYYLSVPLFRGVHDGYFSLKLLNAFLGVITTAAAVALGRAMFGGRRGALIGLAAGTLLALSFPQLLLARQGFRAPTLPFMQTLALLGLWRGLRRDRTGWLLAGGALAGGALYTYMASRLFPVWLLGAGLLLLALDGGQRLQRLRQGIIFFGMLAVTAAPLAIFATQQPDIFLGRLYEVTQPEEAISLGESILRHVRMFGSAGDPLLRYNIPGRPYFTGPEVGLLLLGMGVALWRLLRRGQPLTRTAYGLALLAPLMIVPSVISVGSFPPNHMRSIAMVPLVFILIGVGFEALLSARLRVGWLADFVRRYGGWLAAAGLLLGAALVAQTYFGWAARADLFYETDADLAAATAWLPEHLPEGARVYVAALHREHPTVQIANLPDVVWLGRELLFRPAPGHEGIAVFPRSAPPPDDWAAWLEPVRLADVPFGPDGVPAFQAYRLRADLPLPDLTPPPAPARSGVLTLLGAASAPVFPGAAGEVVLAWEVTAPPPLPDLTPLLQVEDAVGTVLHRAETPFSQTERWQPGEVLLHRLKVAVPPGTPPGRYALRIAWVGRASDQYLSFVEGGIWAQAGELEVLPPARLWTPDELGIDTARQIDLMPGVRLLAWDMDAAARLRPGEDLRLTLYWQGAPGSTPEADIEAVLRAADSPETALWRGQPLAERYPPARWRAGEIVTEPVRWSIPREQAAGVYTLSLRAGAAVVDLGTVEIVGIPRQFEAPPVETVRVVGLGDALRLYGYTLRTEADALRLELVWQTQAAVTTDYTVFVHLLDTAGHIVRQRDVMPVDNTYPTRLWAAGEYVYDVHVFDDLPPGAYQVRVGLYDAATGQRLPLETGGDALDLEPVIQIESGAN